MKRKIVIILMICIGFLLQSTVFKTLTIASISPNLMVKGRSVGRFCLWAFGGYLLWQIAWDACDDLYVHRLCKWIF